MPQFTGTTIDGKPLSKWKQIYSACMKFRRFIVEIREYDPKAEISIQQMRWFHCKAGPVCILADYQGISKKEAEIELKRKCGRQWLVEAVTEDNFKSIEGHLFYECKKSICNKLSHIVQLKGMEKVCPICGSDSLQLINIKSKLKISIENTNQWFTEIFDFMSSIDCPVQPPDPKWFMNELM